ncbi:hypothetical protein DPEC_G00276820 [Dallia pectoralis]|uniref:Uncharacterized protein n=1 Tax=Dallia pectoralis TaxID=75939 RepID=A0ACC2FLM0_DALPE|nr:hypothetical protein DPEC_G00276820 [Dallia pectoralis]
MENPSLEPRSERIARYKAERRRELQECYGNMEELPSKWVRRDGSTLCSSDGPLPRGVNGRTRETVEGRRRHHRESAPSLEAEPNGLEAASSADPVYPRRQCSSGSAGMLSRAPGPSGPDAPQLRTRVSVGRLRSGLLQQTDTPPEKE